MPKNITIGSLPFASPLIQAPLAGISCSAMRRLAWRFGGLAYACTEMLSAHQLAHELDKSPRYHHISSDEGPVCFQLGGNNPDWLAGAACKAQAYGAQLIDLNVGCPKPKIRNKGSGSALLGDPEHLKALILAIKKEASCPVTVKIRVDGDSGDKYNDSVLEVIHQTMPDAVIIHGRNWRDDYSCAVHTEQIASFVRHCPCPVIANGDVSDGKSALHLLQSTGAAGLMVGRAAIGKPWIFQKIQTEMQGDIYKRPALELQTALFIEHLQHLIALEDNEYLGCIQARRLAKHYFADYGLPEDAQQALKHGVCLAETVSTHAA